MNRIFLFLLCLLLTTLAGAQSADTAASLELWGVPLGSEKTTCLKVWAEHNRVPDLVVPGTSFGKGENQTLMFFRSQVYNGVVAKDVQAQFTDNLLTKVSLVFRKTQNQTINFNTIFLNLKKIYDTLYFPSNKSLTQLVQGAAWIFPDGRTIYMGSLLPTELIILIELPYGRS